MEVVLNTYLRLREWEEVGEAQLLATSEVATSSDYSFYFPRGQIEVTFDDPIPVTRAELLKMKLSVLNKQLDAAKAEAYLTVKSVEDKIANLLALPEVASEVSDD